MYHTLKHTINDQKANSLKHNCPYTVTTVLSKTTREYVTQLSLALWPCHVAFFQYCPHAVLPSFNIALLLPHNTHFIICLCSSLLTINKVHKNGSNFSSWKKSQTQQKRNTVSALCLWGWSSNRLSDNYNIYRCISWPVVSAKERWVRSICSLNTISVSLKASRAWCLSCISCDSRECCSYDMSYWVRFSRYCLLILTSMSTPFAMLWLISQVSFKRKKKNFVFTILHKWVLKFWSHFIKHH